MALLIFEQSGIARRAGIRRAPFLAQQSVAIGATSAQSSAFNDGTHIITACASAACHVAVGADPTATTGSFPIAAGGELDLEVTPGHKLAVIQQ